MSTRRFRKLLELIVPPAQLLAHNLGNGIFPENNFYGQKTIIFFAQKQTARFIQKHLQQFGLKTELVFGGQDRDYAQIESSLQKLMEGQLDYILSTSIVEEGLHLPELEVILNYSQPLTGVARMQRQGRVGRSKPGKIVYLLLDHPLENALYWSTHHEAKRIAGATSVPSPLPSTNPVRPRKHVQKSLF